MYFCKTCGRVESLFRFFFFSTILLCVCIMHGSISGCCEKGWWRMSTLGYESLYDYVLICLFYFVKEPKSE